MLLKPCASPPDGDAYAFEFKWDGMRALVAVDGGHVAIQSRNAVDFSAHFPELHELAGAIRSKRLVLDGEIIAPDDRGRPSFELLSARIRSIPRFGLGCRAPVCLMAFDVLAVAGRDMTRLPYLAADAFSKILRWMDRIGRRRRAASGQVKKCAKFRENISSKALLQNDWTVFTSAVADQAHG